MVHEIEYRGRKFLLHEEPTEEELEKLYQVRFGATEIAFPVPMSRGLERREGPYEELPLEGGTFAVSTSPQSALARQLVGNLTALGANVGLSEPMANSEIVDEIGPHPGEVFEYADTDLDGPGSEREYDGLVCDGTFLETVEELERAHQFYHWAFRLTREELHSVVLARPPEEAASAGKAAAQRGLEGLARGIAKEIGDKGSMSNIALVESGAEERLRRPLAYLLSPRSTYVTGQALRISPKAHPHPAADVDTQVLEGKTALVTGATRGIGRATASQFAQEGAEVVCVGRPGSEPLDEIEDAFGGIPVGLDVSDEAAPSRLSEIADEYGGFDIVVHNAGIAPAEDPIGELNLDTWRQVMSVNLDAVVDITDRLLDDGHINNFGRILCTSSINGIAGGDRIGYASGKAGLIGFVRKCADDLADRGITANVVAPGLVETRMSDQLPKHIRDAVGRMNSLYQPGFPSDVANAYTFLATAGGQGVTGRILRVCGGYVVGA